MKLNQMLLYNNKFQQNCMTIYHVNFMLKKKVLTASVSLWKVLVLSPVRLNTIALNSDVKLLAENCCKLFSGGSVGGQNGVDCLCSEEVRNGHVIQF